MLFNSIPFFIFFVVFYICYLPLKHKWQNRFLLVAGYIFYGSWNWRFLFLILASTICDYFFSWKIYNTSDTYLKKRCVALSVIINLCFLGIFKYFNFFAANLIHLLHAFGFKGDFQYLHIILPIGISFYTFQSLSYVIDVYRGTTKPVRNFLDYALYVAFFPQMIAGPIERANHLMPQIQNKRTIDLSKFYQGCFLFFWGFFEKTFVAGNMAQIVDPIYDNFHHAHGGEVLVALYAFAFQIFCDFDGYSNMAKGIAKCLGFDIVFNFNIPYFATNPREFWQRWHISLSNWLKDYLYIPLGGSRFGSLMTYRNLFITMFLGGLWHGAAWTFIFWGIYHGCLLIIYHILHQRNNPLEKSQSTVVNKTSDRWLIFKIFFFFNVIAFGWLFFRAQTKGQIPYLLEALLFHFRMDHQTLWLLVKVFLVASPLLLIQMRQYKSKNLLYLFQLPWPIKTVIYVLLTYLTIRWGLLKPVEFIYFQF